MMVTTRSKTKLTDDSLLKNEEYQKVKVEREGEKRETRKKRKDTGDRKDLDKKRKSRISAVTDKSTVGLDDIDSVKTRTRAEIPGKAESCEATKQLKGKSSWPITVPILVSFFAVIILGIPYISEILKTLHNVPSFSPKEDFRDQLDLLRTSFSSQTPYLWKLIGSVSEDVIVSENPKRPAVILLAGGPDAHQTLDDLASELSTSYYSHLEGNSSVIKIDGIQYKNTDAHDTKRLIDEELKNGFNTGRQVAIVHHFESIPAEASMIFHSYCENDNAPFKRVIIIFTVHIKEKLNPKDNIKINQKKVEQHLESQWKDAIDKDHIEAMFSRVATAVAFVTPE